MLVLHHGHHYDLMLRVIMLGHHLISLLIPIVGARQAGVIKCQRLWMKRSCTQPSFAHFRRRIMLPCLHAFRPWCCLCRVYPQSSFLRMIVQFTGLPWSLTKFFNMILAHLGLITSIYISALQTVTKAPFDRDVIRTIWFCSYASFI